MPIYDAQSTNESKQQAREYVDLDLFFGKRNSDLDVAVTKNAQAVKRSVRNLILYNQYEKPFHPEIYSGVMDFLFELATPITAEAIARRIQDVINNFEPRAKLESVRVIAKPDTNSFDVSIEFFVINNPTELVDMSLMLERLR